MSTYNAKNYTEQGGDRLVIGGELEIKEGATVKGLETGGGEIPLATADTVGGIKAAPKAVNYNIPVDIDPNTGKLYARAVPNASSTTYGLVKGMPRTDAETVMVKIASTGYMYVPTYPVVPVAENHPASTATDLETLLADFNALLAKLKSAGIVAAD